MVSEIIEKVDSEERLGGKINDIIPEDYLMPPNSPLKTRKDVFIMASIVRKEAVTTMNVRRSQRYFSII